MSLFILTLVCGALCAASYTLIIWYGEAGKRRLSKRARRLAISGRGKGKAVAGPRLRVGARGGLDEVMLRLVPRPEALRARLAASGIGWSIGRYGLVSAIVAIVVAVLAMLRGMTPVTGILIGAGAGVLLPHLLIGSRIKKRQAAFYALFPEAVSLMVRGLKAGLPFADTLLVVGREIADPLGEEFRRMSDQIKLGQPIEDSMWAVARRIDLAEFNFLIISLSVQRETGGNLAATLENLEEMLRKRLQMRLKVKAMSSEAKASAAIIGSMPFVMAALLYFVSRDYVMQLFITHMGNLMLIGGACFMGTGVFVMSRMVRFQI
jgi:tight adherence protein B